MDERTERMIASALALLERLTEAAERIAGALEDATPLNDIAGAVRDVAEAFDNVAEALGEQAERDAIDTTAEDEGREIARVRATPDEGRG